MSYRFTVRNIEEIDFERIIREQKARGEEVSLVTFEGPREPSPHAVILIHSDFLRKFQEEDNVLVAGKPLSSTWGGTEVEMILGEGFVYTAVVHSGVLSSGRARTVSANEEEEISRIRREIEAARKYARLIKVKVYSL